MSHELLLKLLKWTVVIWDMILKQLKTFDYPCMEQLSEIEDERLNIAMRRFFS